MPFYGVFFLTNQCHKIWPYLHPTLKITNMKSIEQDLRMVQINIKPEPLVDYNWSLEPKITLKKQVLSLKLPISQVFNLPFTYINTWNNPCILHWARRTTHKSAIWSPWARHQFYWMPLWTLQYPDYCSSSCMCCRNLKDSWIKLQTTHDVGI